MSRPIPTPEQLPDVLRQALARFVADAAGTLFGALPFARLVAAHRSLFAELRRHGASWEQIAALLTAQGVTVRGAPVTQNVLRATFSRAVKAASGAAGAGAKRNGSKRDVTFRHAAKRNETKRLKTKRGETNRSGAQRNDPERSAAKCSETQQGTARHTNTPPPSGNGTGSDAGAGPTPTTGGQADRNQSVPFATGAAALFRRASLTQKPPRTR